MRRKPTYTWHDGFAMPMGFPFEAFASALDYLPDPTDFFIATYPKCGTTWAQNIAYLLTHGGRPLSPSQSLGDGFPHLEEVGAEHVRQQPPPRFVKTHLPYALAPKSADARYLYIVRNPFDCAVSFFHHTRGFVKHYDFADGSFDDFFECFIGGAVDFGDYFEHAVSWLARIGEPNVRMLTYEAMWNDPRAAIRAIGEFVNGEPLTETGIIDTVLEHSSFESMSRDQQRWSSRRPNGMPPFVRKGGIGDWVHYFSSSQCRRVIDRSAAMCSDVRLEALWPDVFAEASRYADE